MLLQQLAVPLIPIKLSKVGPTQHYRNEPLPMPRRPSREASSNINTPQTPYENSCTPNVASSRTTSSDGPSAGPKDSQGSRAFGVHLLLNPAASPPLKPQDPIYPTVSKEARADQDTSNRFAPAVSSVRDPFLDRQKSEQLQAQNAVRSWPREFEKGESNEIQRTAPQSTRAPTPWLSQISPATPSTTTRLPTGQDEHVQRYDQATQHSNELLPYSWRANIADSPDLNRRDVAYGASMPLAKSFTHEYDRTPGDHVAFPGSRISVQADQSSLNIPVDFQAASASADEKRKRNAVASARFRARRRERERADSREIEDLKQEIQNLTEDAEFYRSERDSLSVVVYQLPDRDRYFPRPISPRRRRRNHQTSASTYSDSYNTSAEEHSREPTAQGSEGQQVRKRAKHAQPAMASVPSASSSSAGGLYSQSYNDLHVPLTRYSSGDRLAAYASANSTSPISPISPTSHASMSPLEYTAPSSSSTKFRQLSIHSTASSPTFLPPIMSDTFALTYDRQLHQRQQQGRRERQERALQLKRSKSDKNVSNS